MYKTFRVLPAGLEPAACGLGIHRSIHLSYGSTIYSMASVILSLSVPLLLLTSSASILQRIECSTPNPPGNSLWTRCLARPTRRSLSMTKYSPIDDMFILTAHKAMVNILFIDARALAQGVRLLTRKSANCTESKKESMPYSMQNMLVGCIRTIKQIS